MGTLNGFIVLAEGSRQAAGEDHADELHEGDADADAAQQQRLVVEELQELRQASNLRGIVRRALLNVLRQHEATCGGHRLILEDRAPVVRAFDAAALQLSLHQRPSVLGLHRVGVVIERLVELFL